MPYAYHDIETTAALPSLTLGAHETGLAVVVRYRGRPVGFWMEALPPTTQVPPEALTDRINREAGPTLLVARLREEITPTVPATPLPSLTIAICTRDRPRMVHRCLEALRALPMPEATSSPEVLVVDNAPSDAATREVVATFDGVRYVVEPRPGLNFGRNRALAEAQGDLVAYVDDDAVVDEGWLLGLAEAYTEHPDAGAFTGQVLPLTLETNAQVLFEQRGGFRRGFEKVRYGASQPGNPAYPCNAGIFGTGTNMAFRRDVLQALGGFDEALDMGAQLPGGGDHDIFYRVIRAGYPLVYEPRCLVFHEHRREMETLHRQFADSWGRALMALLAKMYRDDPTQRKKVRRLLRWWIRMQCGRIKRSIAGAESVPLRTIAAEVWGGIMGLAGEYRRSLRRAAIIREGYP
jgi:GT2 family glycosyltransferase